MSCGTLHTFTITISIVETADSSGKHASLAALQAEQGLGCSRGSPEKSGLVPLHYHFRAARVLNSEAAALSGIAQSPF